MLEFSIRLYGLILHLYPRRFRDEYGVEMLGMFEGLARRGLMEAWLRVLLELPATLLREHLDALSQAADPTRYLRAGAAIAFPALAYASLLEHLRTREEVAAVTFWLFAVALGIVIAGGRGAACIRNSLLGSLAACVLLLAIGPAPVGPGMAVVGPLVCGVGTTMALILACYVRLVMEGLRFARAIPAL